MYRQSKSFSTAVPIMSARSSGSALTMLQLSHQQVWLHGPSLHPEPTSGSTFRPCPLHPTPLFSPGACTGYLPSAWSSDLLFSGLQNCPAPQMMAALTISVPKALVNFSCLEKVSVTINHNVFFSISSFDYNTFGKQWCLINVFGL